MTRKRNDGSITRAEATPEQIRCWDCLSSVVGGDHHLGKVRPCGNGIAIRLWGEIATFDDGWSRTSGLLTDLTVAAHHYGIQIGIASGGIGRLKITAHPRRHGTGQQWEVHPSLEDLAAKCIEMAKGDA